MPLALKLSLHKASLEDEGTVLEIFQKCPDYFLRVEGCLATPAIVRSELTGMPKKVSESYKRDFFYFTR